MKAKSKMEIEIGTNPILNIDTNSIFDVTYEIDDDKIGLSINKLTTKINRDFFIENFEILTEPHFHESKKINYYPIDGETYINQYGNIYFESFKLIELFKKMIVEAIKNEEYENVVELKEKISKIESGINEYYSIGKNGEKVYSESLYKIQ